MLKKILFCSLALILTMIIVPLTVSGNFRPIKSSNNNISTKVKSKAKEIYGDEKLKGRVFYYAEKNSTEDYLKCLALIFSSNESIKSKTPKENDKYLTKSRQKAKFDNSYKELNKKIDNAIKEVKDKRIVYKGKTVFVPYSSLTNGKTKGGKSKYLISCSSPWDKESPKYNKNTKTVKGISLYGIKYLTSNGINYKTALLHYLPLCNIK